jgi:quercetin dioxygenase-like cupin family protein
MSQRRQPRSHARPRISLQNVRVTGPGRFDAPQLSDHDLSPEECMALARSAAGGIELDALDRSGAGSYELLWRDEHSEAWLNLWWEPRDTGFHDHGGSCVGVHVLEGRAISESLVVGATRRTRTYEAGETFGAPATAIHRVDHEPGAVTIHVYSPPLAEIGHYEIVDGELHRHAGHPDEISPPSPGLSAALDAR